VRGIKLCPFSLLSVAIQAHCEPILEDGVVAPQNLMSNHLGEKEPT
jgi:hypothetical protein